MERNEIEPLMTIEDVMAFLQVSERSVRNHVKRDGLPAVKIGRSLRFKRDELDEWIRKQSAASKRNAA